MDDKNRKVTIRLNEGMWRLMKRWCLDNDASMQGIIEQLIREHLRQAGARKEQGK